MAKLYFASMRDDDPDCYYLVQESDRQWYDESSEASLEEATLADAVQQLDLNASSANVHELADIHDKLASLLIHHVGEEKAKAILWDVLLSGGIYELEGWEP